MKTVTAFIGSGRKQRGLTYTATRQFLARLESYGNVQVEVVFLSEFNLGLCRGCKACFSRGEEFCPLRGDRDLLIEKMMASDGVVLASPNYSFQVSAIMKALLDRLGFIFHRPCFHGKAFTSIVVQGFYGGGKIVKYLAFVGAGLGFNVVEGSCITGLEPMAEKHRRRMDKVLARQSRRFYEQLSRPALCAPSLFQLMGFRMGRACVRQALTEGDRDFDYYRDRGWFDSAYYFPVELGPFKRTIGAVFDWIFARIYRPDAAPRSGHGS
ncbi:MAG TPA: flavodoxin family protein [Anaeromyxobacteraceae bacterium]|nr:flavodoxin family protein [Anaeromyxobacteraceae bacterium]